MSLVPLRPYCPHRSNRRAPRPNPWGGPAGRRASFSSRFHLPCPGAARVPPPPLGLGRILPPARVPPPRVDMAGFFDPGSDSFGFSRFWADPLPPPLDSPARVPPPPFDLVRSSRPARVSPGFSRRGYPPKAVDLVGEIFRQARVPPPSFFGRRGYPPYHLEFGQIFRRRGYPPTTWTWSDFSAGEGYPPPRGVCGGEGTPSFPFGEGTPYDLDLVRFFGRRGLPPQGGVRRRGYPLLFFSARVPPPFFRRGYPLFRPLRGPPGTAGPVF